MSVRSWVLAISVAALAAGGGSVPLLDATAAPATATAEHAGGAAPGWGPVKVLAKHPRGQSLVVGADDVTTVVWSTGVPGRRIETVRRGPGGRWGTPVVIGRGVSPAVRADGAGNVTVAWISQRRGTTDGVRAAGRPARGHWSDPVRLSRDRRIPGYVPAADGVQGASHVALAAGAGGAVEVAWDWASSELGQRSRIQSAHRQPGGAWTGPQDATPASGANTPQVGVDERGDVVLLSVRQAFGHPQVVSVRRRPAGGAWSEPVTVASEGYGPILAVDRAGRAIVVLTPDFNRVRAVTMPAAGRWGRPHHLSPRGVEIRDYDLALSGSGDAAVALGRGSGRVDLVRRPAGGSWSDPRQVVHPSTDVFDVLVGLDDAGDTFLGWGGYDLQGAYRPHGGRWTAPFTISPDAGVEVLEESACAVAPDGDVVVLWKQEDRPLKVRVRTAS